MRGRSRERFEAAEADRRIAGLLTVATVFAVDAIAGRARVTDGAEWRSDWLPWLEHRAGAAATWAAPQIGEQVMLAAPSGDLEAAVILGAIFSRANPPPADQADVTVWRFRDGARIEHDAASGEIALTVGPANLTISRAGVISIAGDLVVAGNLRVTGETELQGTLINGVEQEGA